MLLCDWNVESLPLLGVLQGVLQCRPAHPDCQAGSGHLHRGQKGRKVMTLIATESCIMRNFNILQFQFERGQALDAHQFFTLTHRQAFRPCGNDKTLCLAIQIGKDEKGLSLIGKWNVDLRAVQPVAGLEGLGFRG